MKKSFEAFKRVVAVFLFVLTAVLTILGAFTTIMMVRDDYFELVPKPFYTGQLCEDAVAKETDRAAHWYFLAQNTKDLDEKKAFSQYYNRNNSNFAYRITDSHNEVVADNYLYDEDFTLIGIYDYYIEDEYYCVEGYMNISMPVSGDTLDGARLLHNALLEQRIGILLLTGLFAFIAIGLFIYLMCKSGHSTDLEDKEIKLTWFDKIPFDVLTFIFSIGGMCSFFPYAVFHRYITEILWATAICSVFLSALFIFYACSFAARVKNGKWYHNTVIYMLCNWSVKAIKSILDSVPIIWKAALVWGGICFFNLLCLLIGGGSFFIWFLVNAAVGVGICFIAIWADKLKQAGEAIEKGDLSYSADVSNIMLPSLRRHGEALNNISKGMGLAVEEKLKSERFKTELITNVSHDIKTPLTSIINYVDLLNKIEIESPEAKEYLGVLDRQSKRLKKLTEDLVEASKASSGTIKPNSTKTNLKELILQAGAEYKERLDKVGINLVYNTPQNDIYTFADGRLLWRVFDNLLGNIVKYSQKDTRAYVDMVENEEKVTVIFKNISRSPLNISADELLKRFVRGDSSRHTEGSGLGLSIAKSLTELQGGGFSLIVDGDLFKAVVTLNKMNVQEATPITESESVSEEEENKKE